jgi:hypothetical protein
MVTGHSSWSLAQIDMYTTFRHQVFRLTPSE